MRFPKTTAGKAMLAGGVLLVGTAVGAAILHHHKVKTRDLPQDPLVIAAPDLEQSLQRQAIGQFFIDGDLADEASRPVQRTVTAGSGDTFLDLLVRGGIDKVEATKAIDALSDVYSPRALKIGQSLTVTYPRPADGIGVGPFSGFAFQPEPGRQIVAKHGSDGYKVSEIKSELTRQVMHYRGAIKGSLFESAMSKGVSASVLAEMIRAFSYDVDFQRDIQAGDEFEVMFERLTDKNGQVVKDGNIIFAKLTLSDDPITIYRYTDSAGMTDYYNAKGESVRKALLKTPVDGAKITSGFGMRLHPILGYSKLHKGIDFGVKSGTPVMAAGNGVIDYAGVFGAYGNYVRIKHDSSHATAYAHLSRFASGIHVGKRVDQGQIIAFSGATGRATGPHLHYEVLVNGGQVNPMSIKFQSGNKLAGNELTRFLNSAKLTGDLLAKTPISEKVKSN